MRKSSVVAVAVLALSAGAMVLGPVRAQDSKPAPAEQKAEQLGAFRVDGVHSMVVFRVGHLGVSYAYGMFQSPEGSFTIDQANPSASILDIRVETKNVNTGNEGRDKHLRSPDFFNAAQYPNIAFRSRSFTKTGDKEFKAQGDLTFMGQTKPIEIALSFVGEGDTAQGYKAGFEAEFKIKRSEWGMTKYLEKNAIGDEVSLYVTIEGKKG